MSTFVLVPGGWHGAWCYREVTTLLRGRGHAVFALTLTGLGDRAHLAHPGVGLQTHIEDVVSAIEAEELSDVILLGHSYAGFVIAGTAERLPDRIRSLVFLDATVPRDGELRISEERDRPFRHRDRRIRERDRAFR
jgi:pimeloyl-ACP methyl ester carboxylesterase